MSNLPATTPRTGAALKPLDVMKGFLGSPEARTAIAQAAPKHMTPDRIMRVVLTAALGQPKIADVCLTAPGKASLIKAMLTATQRGLELDGRQAHLVPFNDKRLGMIVQFVPGYQGMIDLAYNHPKVKSIWWGVIRENDTYEVVDGLERKLIHVKYDGEGDGGALKYAYAVCQMEGGAKTFVCLNRREVMRAKAYSKGADSAYSPWQTSEEAMWAKTAVRALCKQIPQCSELRDLLHDDDEHTTATPAKFTPAAPNLAAIPTQVSAEPAGEAIEAEQVSNEARQEEAEESVAGLAPQAAAQPAKPAPAPAPAKAPAPTPAPAPAPAKAAAPTPEPTETMVAELEALCLHSGITEEQVCKYAIKTYRLSPGIASVRDIYECAPRRVAQLIADFEGKLEAIKQS